MSEDVLFILEILLFKNITVFFFTVLFSVFGGMGPHQKYPHGLWDTRRWQDPNHGLNTNLI